MNNRNTSFVTDLKELGFAYSPSVFSAGTLQMLMGEIDAVLPSSYSGTRRFRWAPLLNVENEISASLLMNHGLREIAEQALGRDVFGVMVDAYRASGPSDLHSDAHEFNLPGVRFNIYLEPLLPGRGALTIFPRSHRQPLWDQLHIDPSLASSLPLHCNAVYPGDLIAMDLRTWHEVQCDESSRLFASVFFYAVPGSEEEEIAVRWSAARNRKALRIFGHCEDGPYSSKLFLRFPNTWQKLLEKYGFTKSLESMT